LKACGEGEPPVGIPSPSEGGSVEVGVHGTCFLDDFQLIAKPNRPTWRFSHWDNEACIGSRNEICVAKVTKVEKTYIACFDFVGPGPTVERLPSSAAGTVDVQRPASSCADGLSLVATPAGGYKFDHWSGEICAGSMSTVCATTAQASTGRHVTANFTPTEKFPCPVGLPWDTISSEPTGVGGVSVNPEWNWQCNFHVVNGLQDPRRDCNNFTWNLLKTPAPELGPACSREITGFDTPSHFMGTVACKTDYGGFPGHVNFRPVMYTGVIKYVDHKELLQGGDDDFVFHLDTEQNERLQLLAPGAQHSPPGATKWQEDLEVEVSGFEALDWFGQRWWRVFKEADQSKNPYGINGHQAVVLGLLNLDTVHGPKTELHPIYAMAIREFDDAHVNPQNDRWAVFARTFGFQGGCGQRDWPLNGPTVSLALPAPTGAGSNVTFTGLAPTQQPLENTAFYVTPRRPGSWSIASGGPGVAIVTFTLSPHNILDGELVLTWSNAYGQTNLIHDDAAQRGQVPEEENEEEEKKEEEEEKKEEEEEKREDSAMWIYEMLPPAKQRLAAALIPAAPVPPADPPLVMASSVDPRPSQPREHFRDPGEPTPPLRASGVKNEASAAVQLRLETIFLALCAVTGGEPKVAGHNVPEIKELCSKLDPTSYALPVFFASGDSVQTSSSEAEGNRDAPVKRGACSPGADTCFALSRGASYSPVIGGSKVQPRHVSFAPGVGGWGLTFDHLSRVAFTAGSAWLRRGDFTLEFWVRPTKAGRIAASRSGRRDDGAWLIRMVRGGKLVYVFDSARGAPVVVRGTHRVASPEGCLSPTGYCKVSVVRQGKNLVAYVDGQRDGAASIDDAPIAAHAKLTVGGSSFKGRVDEIRVYPVAKVQCHQLEACLAGQR
jgi:hypothetical protein